MYSCAYALAGVNVVLPPPRIVIVGGTRYPLPGLVTSIEIICPDRIYAIAVAPVPRSPGCAVISTVGEIVYPAPGSPTTILPTVNVLLSFHDFHGYTLVNVLLEVIDSKVSVSLLYWVGRSKSVV